MPRARRRSSGRPALWLLRIVALAALASTIWLFGPRAWTVLAQRAGAGQDAAVVQLDRVGFRRQPAWLKPPLLLAVARDLAPRLRGEVGLLDEAGAGRLEQSLAASPWTARVGLRRIFPDRMGVDLELRRPVLEVWADAAGPALVLVDRDGTCLPAVVGSGLPRTVLRAAGGPAVGDLLGAPHPDPTVVAAARVAAEWRDEIAPRVPGVPRLVEVDASNLGYRFVGDLRWSEVCVGLARADGSTVYLAYGHPPGSPAPRIACDVKAGILAAMLAEFPGLAGIDRGDLRFANRWRDWLRPRPAPTSPR